MVIQNCAECLVQSCQIKSKTGIGDDCPRISKALIQKLRALMRRAKPDLK